MTQKYIQHNMKENILLLKDLLEHYKIKFKYMTSISKMCILINQMIQLEYVPNWSEVFVTEKVKNTVPWTYAISDLKD